MTTAMKGILFVSGAIVIAVAPVAAITMISNRGPGKLEQSHFIERAGAPALLVIDQAGGRAHAYRMNVIDVHSGVRTQRLFVDGIGLSVIGHNAAHLWTQQVPSQLFSPWTNLGARIEARDPATLAVRIDQAGIEAKNPGIGAGIRAGHSTFDAATGGLRVESRYGDPFFIDGERFTASAAPPSSAPTTRAAINDARRVALPDGSRLQFRDDIKDNRAHLEQVNAADNVYTPIHPDVTYLSPKFVIDNCAGTAAKLDGTYFVEWTKVRGDFDTSVLSRVSATGERLWSTDLPTAEPQNGRLNDGLVIVVMKGAKSYVVALDVKTGEQRWRYDL